MSEGEPSSLIKPPSVGESGVGGLLSQLRVRAGLLAIRPIALWGAVFLVLSATPLQSVLPASALIYAKIIIALCCLLGVIQSVVIGRRRVRAVFDLAKVVDDSLGLKDRVVTLSSTPLTAEQAAILSKQVSSSFSATNFRLVLPARFDWSEWIACGLGAILLITLGWWQLQPTPGGALSQRLAELSTSPELSPEQQKALAAVVSAAQSGSQELEQSISEAQAVLSSPADPASSRSSLGKQPPQSSVMSSLVSSERSSSSSSSESITSSSTESSSSSAQSAKSSEQGSDGSKASADSQSADGSSSGKANAQADQSSGGSSSAASNGSSQSGSGEGKQQSGGSQSQSGSAAGDKSGQGKSADEKGDKAGSAASSGGSQSGGASSGGEQSQSNEGASASSANQSKSGEPQSAKDEALKILSQMKDGAAQNSSGEGGSQQSSGASQQSKNNSSGAKSSGSSGKQSSSGGSSKSEKQGEGDKSSNNNSSAASSGGGKAGVSSSAVAKRFEDGPGGDKGDRGEKFEERSIAPKDEKLDERFTTGDGELSKDENARPGRDLTVGDLQRAKPEAFNDEERQRVPREYERIFGSK